MLVTNLELTDWCPVHVVPLQDTPRLNHDPGRGSWFLVLSSMHCPGTATQTDCIGKWIAHLVPEEITPDQARARAKETQQ